MPDSWFQRNFTKRIRSNGRYPTQDEYLIDLRNVVKVYDSTAGRFVALKGIDLQIRAGEFVAVVGKSGSGKSTLLNMLTGIDRPTSGEVVVNHTLLNNLSEGKMAVWRGRNLGIVFQFFQLLPTLTVLENVLLPMDFCRRFSLRERKGRALHLLDLVGLSDQARKLPSGLSGGQQQRVAIARALANDPPILVADEPTGNLDTKTAAVIFSLFENLIEQKKTIVMVTHDQDLALKLSRMVTLVDGRMVENMNSSRGRMQPFRSTLVEEAPPEDLSGEIELVSRPASVTGSESGSAMGLVEADSVRQRVLAILGDRPNAARLLRDEFYQASKSRSQTDALYQVVLFEIRSAAALAEQANRPDEARTLWKILADATEPWARHESGKNE